MSALAEQVKDSFKMQKPAETKTPIHELLAHRWSPRAFSERPVKRDKLLSIFEAARWAPSSRNEQPWAYLLATKEEDRKSVV
jgi:nitroreductase